MRRAVTLLALAAALAASWSCVPGRKIVIPFPLPGDVDLEGIAVVGVVEWDGDVGKDRLGREGADLLRKALKKRDCFRKIRVVALKDFLNQSLRLSALGVADQNTAFWRQLGESLGVDGIIYGTFTLSSQDRSGYYETQWVDPETGMIRYSEQYEHRTQYAASLRLHFRATADGREVLACDDSKEETILDLGLSPLPAFYRQMGPMVHACAEKIAKTPVEKGVYLLD